MKFESSPTWCLVPLFAVFVLSASSTELMARNFRVNMLPNGSAFDCNTCHTSGGGSARNPFGLAVQARVTPNGSQPFWDFDLAQLDSDGDGTSNGEELRDPFGTGTPIDSVNVTNPGDPNSKPPEPNTAPGFTTSPTTTATIGVLYSYQAGAFDQQGHSLTFSKVSGPDWLSVSATGLVSGTPPEGSSGQSPVSVRVTDNGTPNLSGNQNYSITVTASFTGFRNLNFNLPGEAAIATPDQDPDLDNLPNFVEYALRTNPRSADTIAVPGFPGFDGTGRMQFVLQVRDDDPNLTIQLETSSELPFNAPTTIEPVVTDPNGSDGFETWTFTDSVESESIMQRFGRLKFEPGE